MKNQQVFKLIGLIGFSVLAINAYGQQRGEVQDQEFIIRKDRVLTLPKQPRNYERIPVLPTPRSSSNYTYQVHPFLLNLPPVEIRPEAALKQFPRNSEEMFPGFARLGYGNYSSPLAELRYNNWEEGDYNFGIKLKHEGFYTGPVGGKNSAEDHTVLGADGTLFMDYFQLRGGIEYNRDKYNFYGYDPEDLNLADFIPSQNIFNTFKLHGGIQNLEKMDELNYKADVRVRVFNDNYQAAENELGIHGELDFWFNDQVKTAIHGDISLTSPKDEFYTDINRNYFKVNPFVAYRSEGLSLQAGANIIFENDATDNKKADFHIFPAVHAAYMLHEGFGIYADFEGDVIRKTYYDFVMENPFLGPSEQLLNTIQNYQAKAGVKGVLNDEFTYQVGVNFGNFQNMHFFANSQADSLRFNLLYDSDTRVINYETKITWEYDGWYKLMGAANYYHYTLGTLQSAYQRPEWEVTMNNNFMFSDRWLIQANANLMGGIRAYNFQSDIGRVLPAILDLQAKIDYQIAEQVSVFVVGNNLLNRQNQRFLNYPVRGIQGIGGLTIKF